MVQAPQIGKRGAEHRVCADITHACTFIKLLEPRFDGRDIAQDTVLRQVGNHLPEDLQCIFQRHGIDDQFGAECVYFVHRGETLRIVHEPQPFGIDVIYCRLMVETQQVHEE